MCQIIADLVSRLPRSDFVGAASAAAVVSAMFPGAALAQELPRPARLGSPDARTRLILLGTSGGPGRPGPSMISSALVVNGMVYVIDCGEGVGRQLDRVHIPGPPMRGNSGRIRAVFLTHLHSDHVIDYPNLFMLIGYNGFDVYGPGRRGVMEPVYGDRPAPPVTNPQNPTPGTVDMTNALLAAFATDINDRLRDAGGDPARYTRLRPHDITLPKGTGDDPNGRPSPPMEPFHVYDDENVRVTATLVYHAPIFPAFAFRFDTADGSVVFSGDTAPNQNLVRLARGADILVHEVIDRQWIAAAAKLVTVANNGAAAIHHLESAHTPTDEVGKIAEAAGAKMLVLSHLVPGDLPEAGWQGAQAGYSGRLVVGHDLLEIALPL